MSDCGKDEWFGKALAKQISKTPGGETEKSFTKFIRDAHFSLLCLQLVLLSIQDSHTSGSSSVKEDKIVLWVDDNPENNTDEINSGKEKYGIKATQAVSTSEAKKFLSKHGALKSKPSRNFRVITDIYREDEGPKAAENLIEHMRTNGWDNVPILIYCSSKLTPPNFICIQKNSHSLFFFKKRK